MSLLHRVCGLSPRQRLRGAQTSRGSSEPTEVVWDPPGLLQLDVFQELVGDFGAEPEYARERERLYFLSKWGEYSMCVWIKERSGYYSYWNNKTVDVQVKLESDQLCNSQSCCYTPTDGHISFRGGVHRGKLVSVSVKAELEPRADPSVSLIRSHHWRQSSWKSHLSDIQLNRL